MGRVPLMRIEHDYTFAADVDAVFAIIVDPALYEAAAVRSRAMEHTVSVQDVHHVHTIEVERHLPTDDVPSFAQGFVGDRLVVRETTWWKKDGDGYAATFDVVIVGKPVTMKGTMTLRPGGDGITLQRIEADLKAQVPLLGGRIESAVREPVDHQIRIIAEMVADRVG